MHQACFKEQGVLQIGARNALVCPAVLTSNKTSSWSLGAGELNFLPEVACTGSFKKLQTRTVAEQAVTKLVS